VGWWGAVLESRVDEWRGKAGSSWVQGGGDALGAAQARQRSCPSAIQARKVLVSGARRCTVRIKKRRKPVRCCRQRKEGAALMRKKTQDFVLALNSHNLNP